MVKPFAIARSRWAQARWLVLAPHPDDETLGAGALIADTAGRGRLGAVAFLTDGSGSHPQGGGALVATRRKEAACALRRLGAGSVPVQWIGWRDAHPCTADSLGYRRDAMAFAAMLRSLRIDAIAVTAANEAHGDHVAAHHFARFAIACARRPIHLFAYHVWSEAPTRGMRLRSAAMPPARRLDALRAHRSQLTASMGPGFRLPRAMQRMPATDTIFPVRILP
jgi:N-acetylglucosamine malate deacetylase 1